MKLKHDDHDDTKHSNRPIYKQVTCRRRAAADPAARTLRSLSGAPRDARVVHPPPPLPPWAPCLLLIEHTLSFSCFVSFVFFARDAHFRPAASHRRPPGLRTQGSASPSHGRSGRPGSESPPMQGAQGAWFRPGRPWIAGPPPERPGMPARYYFHAGPEGFTRVWLAPGRPNRASLSRTLTPCGGEVRHGVTSGVSRETSLNKHVTPHLHWE